MKNKKNITIAFVGLLLAIGAFFLTRSTNPEPEVAPVDKKASLPINTIPVEERPFITLTPDSGGRNLDLLIDNATVIDEYEYELVYDAGDKQEGAFGRIDLNDEELPVEKTLLLGSKSAGGSVTYHEGVTGGSLTVTYQDTKLKEQFNFLRFDPDELLYSSVDSRFTVEFAPRSLSSGAVIVIMKTFGLPEELDRPLRAGPYLVATSSPSTEDATISISLSAGDYTNPQILEWDGEEWVELDSSLSEGIVEAQSLGASVYVVVSD